MPQIRISHAATLLGVSDDTVRRWLDEGRLVRADAEGPATVDGTDLARLATELAASPTDDASNHRSARNTFVGLVTRVLSDQVMSQVELQCGPFRVVSLISTEAVRDLGLEVGVVASAVVKATNVTIETPRTSPTGTRA